MNEEIYKLKFVFHCEKCNFEHIGKSVHTAEYLELIMVLNIYIQYLMFYTSRQLVKWKHFKYKFTFNNYFMMNKDSSEKWGNLQLKLEKQRKRSPWKYFSKESNSKQISYTFLKKCFYILNIFYSMDQLRMDIIKNVLYSASLFLLHFRNIFSKLIF